MRFTLGHILLSDPIVIDVYISRRYILNTDVLFPSTRPSLSIQHIRISFYTQISIRILPELTFFKIEQRLFGGAKGLHFTQCSKYQLQGELISTDTIVNKREKT